MRISRPIFLLVVYVFITICTGLVGVVGLPETSTADSNGGELPIKIDTTVDTTIHSNNEPEGGGTDSYFGLYDIIELALTVIF